ncbi:hypothetical protein DL763_002869 [Monosporascus cannonballus]|nr:hypothetical protein DL763_002869 [Monosporascus cannonballus]
MERCTKVTPMCPVEATTYGYYPVLGVNSALCVVFGVLCILQVIFCLLTRVRAYSIVIACGCLLECLGYGGRLIMHNNPWDPAGMKLQIVCIIIAPTFIVAGIYLTLKHVVRENGSQFSRIKPALYTWIFVGCDIGSIVLQAIGGGVAAAAEDDMDLLEIGNGIIIAGIAFQVATMLTCGLLAAEYIIKVVRYRRCGSGILQAQEKRSTPKAHIFKYAVIFAYLAILVRCIYRLPEMAGGWGNPRMRNEKEFLILDGLMVALGTAALTLLHPGFFYPYMNSGPKENRKQNESSSEQLGDVTL